MKVVIYDFHDNFLSKTTVIKENILDLEYTFHKKLRVVKIDKNNKSLLIRKQISPLLLK